MSHKVEVVTAGEEANFISEEGFTMNLKVNEAKTGVNVLYYGPDGELLQLDGDEDHFVVGDIPFSEDTIAFFYATQSATAELGCLPDHSFEV